MTKPWHEQTVVEALDGLESSATGLTAVEAAQRLDRVGPNELREQRHRTPLRMLLSQFGDFPILVLLAAALLAGLMGDAGDAVPILAIVILNAVIGFCQEYRAAAAIAQLRRMAGQTAIALRDGHPVPLAAADLVPGDVVLVEAGNVVPADLRLMEAARLRTEEAALTGESLPVDKETTPLTGDLPLGDRRNLAFKGTVVVTGRGRGVVVATGMATELGRIATLLEETEESATPLQRRLARFGLWLAVAIIAICAILFLVGYLRGEAPLLMFLTAVSLAVAAIPEALPAVVTIALALGARRMAHRQALVRRLPAVETLGSVTHICTDKTGTLTRNRMAVTATWPPDAASGDGERARLLRAALLLCTDVRPTAEGKLLGDPTETALYGFAMTMGADPQNLNMTLPRVAELPFSSERVRMTTFHRDGTEVVAFMKGGAEAILAASVDAMAGEARVLLDREEVLAAAERLSADGLRVLAVATARWPALPHPLEPETAEAGFTFLGLVGMLDPPRPEAEPAVALCKSAGIVPVMITGDHPATATAIARQLGILEPGGEVVTGAELGRLDPGELGERSERIRVYARVAPEQKLAIVRALQGRGHVVAMTGDGVNDAPALKCADIGVAMGEGGTDVAREAAALVLLDDNFATIVTAVEEGRRIYANILKFIVYSLTGNAGTLWAITLAPFLGLPLPLLPLQILWLNLLCDSLPGLALAVEPAEERLMARPPIAPGEGIFARGRGLFILGYGLAIGAVALLLQSVALRYGLPWQTMVFTFLVCNRMAVALVVRSPRRSLLHTGLLSNRSLAGAVVVVFALQLAAVYLSPLGRVLKTTPLSLAHLGLVLVLAMGMIVFAEGVKWVRGRFERERHV